MSDGYFIPLAWAPVIRAYVIEDRARLLEVVFGVPHEEAMARATAWFDAMEAAGFPPPIDVEEED